MKLFARPRAERRDIASDLLAAASARRMGSGTAGQVVNENTALQSMAVWRCRHLIADIVSGLPIDQFRSSGKRREQMPASEFVRKPSVDRKSVV